MSQVSKLRLGAALWATGMVGVVTLTLTVLPQILERLSTQVSTSVVIAASLIQSALLLAAAAWLGAALSRPLGLRAPVIEAVLEGAGVWPAARRLLVPGALLGLVAGAWLLAAGVLAPPEIVNAGQTFKPPAAARLLYGGITEEVLTRWGLVTLFVWLAWRFLQARQGSPRPGFVVAAILLAALLFGLGHLPAAAALGIPLTPSVLAYLLIGNAVPGVLFGIAYWRWGLEAAFLAHALAHLFFIVLS